MEASHPEKTDAPADQEPVQAPSEAAVTADSNGIDPDIEDVVDHTGEDATDIVVPIDDDLAEDGASSFARDALENEATRVDRRPWLPQRRVIWLAAAIVLIGVSAGLIALVLNRPPGGPQGEDPLALYQIANELHLRGEEMAALQMLERARKATSYPRAIKQIDSLASAISGSPLLKRAQQLLYQQQYAAARDVLDALLEANPRDERATLLRSIIPPQSTNTTAPAADLNQLFAGGRNPPPPPKVATPGQGSVHVASAAVGTVFIDGVATDRQTPTTLNLPAGPHTITVLPLLDPSVTMRQQIMVRPNKLIRLHLEMPAATGGETAATGSLPEQQAATATTEAPTPAAPHPKKTKGTLVVLAINTGDVLIDGKNTGKRTPAKIVLPAGPHTVVVVLRKSGLRLSRKVRVRAGATRRVLLSPRPGQRPAAKPPVP